MLSLSFNSCKEDIKSVSNDNAKSETILIEKNARVVDGDPSFEKELDTISLFGPHSITRSVLEDRNGNIWIASWEGIICYNGKSFTNYTLKDGLRQFHVFSILEDRSGNLWFGMIGGGVYKFNGNTFTNFTTEQNLAGNSVLCIMEDMTGNIWLGTNEGASCYNGSSFITYTTKHGLINNSIQSMTIDRAGKIWFGTNGGISIFDGKRFSDFDKFNGTSFNNVKSLLTDRTGNIYISCREGFIFFNGTNLIDLSTALIGSAIEDRSGNIWITGGGANSPDVVLSKYDPQIRGEHAFTRILSKNDNAILGEGEFNKQIFGITVDRTGNIWFGTAKGVCKYDGKTFRRF